MDGSRLKVGEKMKIIIQQVIVDSIVDVCNQGDIAKRG